MLKIEYMSIADLNPYEGNAKEHPERQIEQIAESIKEFGFCDPVAISGDNIIIEGHGRVLAAQLLAMDTVPVIRLDGLTDDQRKAYTLVHNQLTMNSGFDLKALEIELQGINGIEMGKFDFDISAIQFDIIEQEEKHLREKEKTDFKDNNYLNTGYGIFEAEGKYDIPVILPTYEMPEVSEWIGFNYATGEKNPEGKGVHFFLDDYQFERLWNNPMRYVEMLKRFACVCSPDFSPMPEMPFVTQIFNHYRKHWLARLWQENGITVIPTVRAGSDAKSFEYCFDGEPHESIVMYSAQWTQNKANRAISQQEYDTMLERLNPSKILVYTNSKKEWLDFRGRNTEKVQMFRQSHWG